MIQKILLSLSSQANLLIRTKLTKPLQALTSDISELIYFGGSHTFVFTKTLLDKWFMAGV